MAFTRFASPKLSIGEVYQTDLVGSGIWRVLTREKSAVAYGRDVIYEARWWSRKEAFGISGAGIEAHFYFAQLYRPEFLIEQVVRQDSTFQLTRVGGAVNIDTDSDIFFEQLPIP